MKCPICGNENTRILKPIVLPDGCGTAQRLACLSPEGEIIHCFTEYVEPGSPGSEEPQSGLTESKTE